MTVYSRLTYLKVQDDERNERFANNVTLFILVIFELFRTITSCEDDNEAHKSLSSEDDSDEETSGRSKRLKCN